MSLRFKSKLEELVMVHKYFVESSSFQCGKHQNIWANIHINETFFVDQIWQIKEMYNMKSDLIIFKFCLLSFLPMGKRTEIHFQHKN